MKGLVARLVVNTVLRGEDVRNRFARWSRWFRKTSTIDESRFQGADEPYPRHWRHFPDKWPAFNPADPAVMDVLASAFDELPHRWRDAVIGRDIRQLSPAEASEHLGVSPEQERAMLNRARATLRAALAKFLAGQGD